MSMIAELGAFRGREIPRKAPACEVPCHERSAPECRESRPVVSVHMLAYNHERTIRESIEAILAQRTDFSFELVIGEDASTDGTREICFEYQARHPARIRVLWSERNVFSVDGNMTRTTEACRGEFIAFCEGDDCWTDPGKLQRQVDAMRRFPGVGLCFTDGTVEDVATGETFRWGDGCAFSPGVVPRRRFLAYTMFGADPRARRPGREFFIPTASVMVRGSVFREAMRTFDIFTWHLSVDDAVFWLGTGALSDAYYIAEPMIHYRQMPMGLTVHSRLNVNVDTNLVRVYYAIELWGFTPEDFPSRFMDTLLTSIADNIGADAPRARRCWRLIRGETRFGSLFRHVRNWPLSVLMSTVGFPKWLLLGAKAWQRYLFPPCVPERIAKIYRALDVDAGLADKGGPRR